MNTWHGRLAELTKLVDSTRKLFEENVPLWALDKQTGQLVDWSWPLQLAGLAPLRDSISQMSALSDELWSELVQQPAANALRLGSKRQPWWDVVTPMNYHLAAALVQASDAGDILPHCATCSCKDLNQAF